MLPRFLRPVVSLAVLWLVLSIAACFGTGSSQLVSSVDPTNGGTSTDGGDNSLENGPSASQPGSVDTRPGPLPPGGIPLTEHEPSVFSTQIGEGHTPERPEDHCDVEIHLALAAIAVDHDFVCNPGWTPSSKGPVATLSSQDRGYAFSQSYQANCDLKGWELNIETEATFRYSYETLLALPRTFDLTVEVLHDGVWEEVRDYTLSFTCPWPPPECLEDCEPVPHATELPVPTDDGSSGRTL